MVKTKQFRLATAVLASSLFFAAKVHADLVVIGPNFPAAAPVDTLIQGNITILNTGQLSTTGSLVNVDDAIRMNNPLKTIVTINPGNTNIGQNAVLTTQGICLCGPEGNGITIDSTSPSSIITVGAGSNIFAYGSGIEVNATNAKIDNNGGIFGAFNAIQINSGGSGATVNNTFILRSASGFGSVAPIVDVAGASFTLNNSGIIDNSNPVANVAVVHLNSTGGIINNSFPGGAALIQQVLTTHYAIIIDGASNTINNSVSLADQGQIISFGGDILINGANTTINNNIAGQINVTSLASTLPAISVQATGLTLTNAGIILNVGPNDTITLNADFNSITNTSTGLIRKSQATTGGSAINITAAASGPIQNSGTIQGGGGANTGAVAINGLYTGILTNSGSINTVASKGTNAIYINNGFNSIVNNAGANITAVTGDKAIFVAAGATGVGTISNAGTITSSDQPAITLGGSIAGITNTGSITVTAAGAPAAIYVSAPNVVLTDGITNSGIISNVGTTAINLSAGGVGINIPLIQTAGTITGDVLLGTSGGNTALSLSGGTINGNVTAFGATSEILALSGGTITGTTTLGPSGDIVNLTGSSLQALVGGAGNDVYNISGGSLTSLTDASGKNTLNLSNATIAGNVDFSGSAGPNTLNLNSGVITGTTTLGNGGDTVNANGTSTGPIVGGPGNDIFNISAGTIASLSSGGGGNKLTMTGGTITGTVDFSAATASNTLDLSGGVISGTTTLGNFNDTVNLSGTSMTKLIGGTGDDIYNLTGGSLSSVTDGGGANTFNLSNLTITGNVDFSGSGGPNTFNLMSGAIGGSLLLGDGGDTVNISGTNLHAIFGGAGNDIVNFNGGSFTSFDGGGGANNTLNVNASLTTSGALTINNVQTITVNNAGTVFTANNAITNLDNLLSIGPGATMIANADVTGAGSVINNGTLAINNSTMNMGGSFTNNGGLNINANGELIVGTSFMQNAGAYFAMQIQDPTTFGNIDVTAGGANLASTSTINPYISSTAFIPAGILFPIITTATGVIDASTLVNPSSALVFFTKNVIGNDLVLTSGRRTVVSQALNPIAQAVATALDSVLAQGPPFNPDLLNLIVQLDNLPDSVALTAALMQLAPPFNGTILEASHLVMETNFDSLQHRLEDLRGLKPLGGGANSKLIRDEEFYNAVDVQEELYNNNGMNYGDINDIYGGRGCVGAWIKVGGSIIDQHKRNQIEGYLMYASDLAIGGDLRLGDIAALGVSLGYEKEDSTENTAQANTLNTKSYQITFYGWFEPMDAVYLDAMIGVATHQYTTVRHINIGNIAISPTATFNGLQYGIQMDMGYVFLSDGIYYVAPFARAKFTSLNIDDYAEKNGGGIGLGVTTHQDIQEKILGAGLRFAAKKDFVTAVYVPEIYGLIGYDFAGQAQSMDFNFLGGGIAVPLSSIEPPKLFYLFGLQVNAHTSDNYTATVKFNFEYKNQFFGYNGFFQLHYTWD